jgi:hypothetical protein
LTEAEVAWLAGFLEGEGSFYMKRQRSDYLMPMVKVGGTDLDTIQYAAQLLGNPAVQFERRRQAHWKDQWKVYKHGQPAVEVMKQILPWMGSRRSEKIREIIAIWEGRQKPPLKKPLAAEVRQWAHDQGLTVSDRGRIPFEVWAAFRSVTPPL